MWHVCDKFTKKVQNVWYICDKFTKKLAEGKHIKWEEVFSVKENIKWFVFNVPKYDLFGVE